MVHLKNDVKTFNYNGAHWPPTSKLPGMVIKSVLAQNCLLFYTKYVLSKSLIVVLGICILNPAEESTMHLR